MYVLFLFSRSSSPWTVWAQTSPRRRAWKGCLWQSRSTPTATTAAAAGQFTGPTLRSRSSATRWGWPAGTVRCLVWSTLIHSALLLLFLNTFCLLPLWVLQGAERKLRDEEKKQLRKRIKGKNVFFFLLSVWLNNEMNDINYLILCTEIMTVCMI